MFRIISLFGPPEVFPLGDKLHSKTKPETLGRKKKKEFEDFRFSLSSVLGKNLNEDY